MNNQQHHYQQHQQFYSASQASYQQASMQHSQQFHQQSFQQQAASQTSASPGSTTVSSYQTVYFNQQKSVGGYQQPQPNPMLAYNRQEQQPHLIQNPQSGYAAQTHQYSAAQAYSQSHGENVPPMNYAQPQQVQQMSIQQHPHASVPYQQPQKSVEPIITEPDDLPRAQARPSSPRTNILSHTDGSMLLQEAFISAGTIDFDTGYAHLIDLQGIWARMKSSKGDYEMKLSLRMANSSQYPISGLRLTLLPNAFGLTCDGTIQSLSPGQTKTCALTLTCKSENQKITQGEWTQVLIVIEYCFGQNRRIQTSHPTQIPLHIFFQEHPQLAATTAVDIDMSNLSSSEKGPRLDQQTFLQLWGRDLTTRNFDFSGVPWMRYMSQFSHVMHGSDPRNSTSVIRILEHKMSMNRIYVVASREANNELVFYVSFKIGESLWLAEVRLRDGKDRWSECSVTLKTSGNPAFTAGVERAVRAILLS
jgi:hypothetical protein